MDSKRIVIATLVGALILSITGYAIFGIAFSSFYTDFMSAGSATGVERQPMLLWAIAVGMLSYSLLLTLAVAGRSGSASVAAGTVTGAVVSFLLWLTADFMLYGISNVGDLAGVMVDPLLEAVPGAIAGGAIAAVLGRVRIGPHVRIPRRVQA